MIWICIQTGPKILSPQEKENVSEKKKKGFVSVSICFVVVEFMGRKLWCNQPFDISIIMWHFQKKKLKMTVDRALYG